MNRAAILRGRRLARARSRSGLNAVAPAPLFGSLGCQSALRRVRDLDYT